MRLLRPDTGEAGERGVAPKDVESWRALFGHAGGTLDTAKGEPKASRTGGVGDGESVEGRQLAKGNTVRQNAPRMQSRTRASNALDRVREAATERFDVTTRGGSPVR